MSIGNEISLPHMRGDEPFAVQFRSFLPFSLPHMRGDEPCRVVSKIYYRLVCPTCVGMNRPPVSAGIPNPSSAPHAWG